MSDKANLKKVAKRETYYSTLAGKEGRGAQTRANKEKGAAKKDSEWEVKVDKKFATLRKRKAIAAKRKAERL